MLSENPPTVPVLMLPMFLVPVFFEGPAAVRARGASPLELVTLIY